MGFGTGFGQFPLNTPGVPKLFFTTDLKNDQKQVEKNEDETPGFNRDDDNNNNSSSETSPLVSPSSCAAPGWWGSLALWAGRAKRDATL